MPLYKLLSLKDDAIKTIHKYLTHAYTHKKALFITPLKRFPKITCKIIICYVINAILKINKYLINGLINF